MAPIIYRPITDDEYPAFARALAEGFSTDLDDEFVEMIRSTLPVQRTLAAFDGDAIVGTFGGYDLELTVPGGAARMEGTTIVTVFPTHRRLGLMGEMMRLHLDKAVESGYPVAGLWSSESSIYGRYGYGIASYSESITASSRDIAFIDGVELDRVRRISVGDATVVLPPIFDAALPRTPGMFGRTAAWWKEEVLTEVEWRRQGKTRIRIVVHDGPEGPDGYAIYRHKRGESNDGHAAGTVHVEEIITASDRAHASLWSYLTNVDGSPNLSWWNCRIDDPIHAKIIEPRRLRRESKSDGLWVRILDVAESLGTRTYEHDDVLRFRVADDYLEDLEGTYELAVADGVGVCARVDGEADVDIDIDVLGALYLGGGDALAYASAGRVRGSDSDVMRLHRLFRTARAPWCNQVF